MLDSSVSISNLIIPNFDNNEYGNFGEDILLFIYDNLIIKITKKIEAKDNNLNFNIIKAEGFNDGIFTRIVTIKKNDSEIILHALYKFCYRLFNKCEISFIEIRKL